MRHRLPGNGMQALRKGVLHRDPFPLLLCIDRRGFLEAANKLGLHSVCGRVSMEQMQQAPLPCILHWNQNHFVVLYKQKRGKKFYIADPGKGLITYNLGCSGEGTHCRNRYT